MEGVRNPSSTGVLYPKAVCHSSCTGSKFTKSLKTVLNRSSKIGEHTKLSSKKSSQCGPSKCTRQICLCMFTRIHQLYINLLRDKYPSLETVQLPLVFMTQVSGVTVSLPSFSPCQFWTVAPMEHLLARLEADSSAVRRRIISLVFYR